MNWMNLPQEYRQGKFVIVPISYEKDVTFGTGAAKGPVEIIKASKHLEYYDDQFDCEPFADGVEQLDVLELSDKSPETMVQKVQETIACQKDKFVISLGGDHAVTIGIVKGLESLHNDFSIIQFDAHADLRDSWNGSSLNHACVAKQISKNRDLCLIGIRSMDVEEKKTIDENDNIHLISAYENPVEKLTAILPKLKQKVYITIDVDAFDPTFIRNTGTPEPGGLSWRDVTKCLELIFKHKQVIGADIVEFAPNENFESEAYALAKLCYKIMAMKKRFNQ